MGESGARCVSRLSALIRIHFVIAAAILVSACARQHQSTAGSVEGYRSSAEVRREAEEKDNKERAEARRLAVEKQKRARDEDIKKIEPALNAWMRCVYSWAAEYAKSNESADTVASAAFSSCTKERTALREAIRPAGRNSLSEHERMEVVENRMRRNLTGFVLRVRLARQRGEEQPPPPPKPRWESI
jgi:hypothetical protein